MFGKDALTWNEFDNFIAVRAGDAHSWVEVYFPGQGWTTFDPTPAGESDLLGRGSSSLLDKMRRIADTIRFKWFKWVIEYDLYAQLSLFRSFGKSLKNGANAYFREPIKRAVAWAKRHRAIAGLVLGTLVLLIVAISAWRQRKRTDKLLAPRATAKRRNPIVRNYLAALRSLAKRGHRRHDATTPREFAQALTASETPGAASLGELTELYYRAEFSEQGLDEDDIARTTTLAAQVEADLKAAKTRRRKS